MFILFTKFKVQLYLCSNSNLFITQVVSKYCGVIRTLTVSNRRSKEHSQSAELQGKEIKVVTSSLRVDAVAARGLNISRKSVLLFKKLPHPPLCFCFSRTIWEIALEGHLMLNGIHVNKKSTEVIITGGTSEDD